MNEDWQRHLDTLRVRVEPVSTLDTEALTELTLRRMSELVQRDLSHPCLAEWTSTIKLNTPGLRQRDLIHTTWRLIRGSVRYVDDSELVLGWHKQSVAEAMDCEVLVSPARLVSMAIPSGDCDDFAMLGKCLLKRVGVESVWVTIKGNPYEPSEWSHVYLSAWDGEKDEWLSFDGSHGKYCGWETENQWEKREWDI